MVRERGRRDKDGEEQRCCQCRETSSHHAGPSTRGVSSARFGGPPAFRSYTRRRCSANTAPARPSERHGRSVPEAEAPRSAGTAGRKTECQAPPSREPGGGGGI